MAILDDDEVRKHGRSKFAPVEEPEAPQEVEERESAILKTIAAALAQLALSNNQAVALSKEMHGQVVRGATTQDVVASAIVRALKQNQELLVLVRESLDREPPEEKERPPQQWVHTPEYYDNGALKRITSKELK